MKESVRLREREKKTPLPRVGEERTPFPLTSFFFRTRSQFRSLGVLLGTFVTLAEQLEKYFKFFNRKHIYITAFEEGKYFFDCEGPKSRNAKKGQKQQKKIQKNKLRAGPRRK